MDTNRIVDICSSLKALAEMARRQKRFVYLAHLLDAADLLALAYPPPATPRDAVDDDQQGKLDDMGCERGVQRILG